MKAIKLLLVVSILFILTTVGGVAVAQTLSPGGDTTPLSDNVAQTLSPGEDTTPLSDNNISDSLENHSLFFKTQDWSLEGNADTDPDINFLGTTDNQPLIIKTNDAEVMHITSDGSVGIGTSNPQSKLHVRGGGVRVNNGNFARIRMTANNPSDDVRTFIDARGDGTNRGQLGTLSNHDLVMFTNSQPRMSIENDGNVGIGTTNPNHELVVQGDDPAMQIRDDTNDNSTNAARLELLERAGGNFDGGAFFWWNGENNKLLIGTKNQGTNKNVLVIDRGGSNVGIGTANPGSNNRLAVNGRIRAKEVVVETGWSDFVFNKDYNLSSLSEVEQYIHQYRHLPGIPSANEVASNGVQLGEMESLLLQKIEELTLHLIDMHERIEALEQANAH